MKKCDFCLGTLNPKFVAKDRLNKTKKEFIWQECSKCGLIQLPGVKNNEYFQEYYFKNKDSLLDKIIYRSRFRIFKNFVNKKSRILEVGCGSGRFLNFLHKKGFKNIWGVEYSTKSLDFMKQFKFQSSKNIPKKEFDIIILEASFEHMENPTKEFEKINKTLSKKGILIITIPNIESLQAKKTKEYWFHLDTPRHLFMFKKINILNYCKKFNLKLIKDIHFNFQYELPGWIYSKKRKPTYKFINNFLSLIYTPYLIYTSITKQSSVITYILARKSI